MRNFALRDKNGNEICVFTSKSPLQAAKDAPAWIGDKIWKPMVKKVGVEKLEEV
jgi:Non-histone chromosomal protein MC1